ncbi:uncharacterized protein Z518_02674 [Rhinocladiella mackenziei CBS 650.93]|uniref:Rhinocladiella mackenziei CBS 650.93 unplaced genomic scaffold supercont1.2, whole genome shotgun sequence n=1 Tax=Rhinocladiella mackenziei CBS 650.93 TaxID=1442369 RepID=A0A0D2IQ73_9EURO|nr:uncharacterized protein Z518_02674 [Rhinocladiella mackenziei CBS 650.93]KIX08019.1 hypothetical protein Z518_02674 [Rhinocladiella mackenziei CBS 650.93]
MQRQRLALTTMNSSSPIRLLHKKERTWVTRDATTGEISDLLSIRIVGVTGQCTPSACREEKEAFGIGNQELKDAESEAHWHRLLLDMDGNSFSGRFYRLLRTNSVVLKQTVFQEWHDDRLVPWVHFVPISTSFEELPEVTRFLAKTDEGRSIAHRIASESKEWARQALREIDLQLVWFRLLLEYGRLENGHDV